MSQLCSRTAKSLLVALVSAGVAIAPIAITPAHAAIETSPRIAAAGSHAGMTWVVRRQGESPAGLVSVGADTQTDAYKGDTASSATLPILCLYVDNSPVPAGLTPDFYEGWARGWVGLTTPIQGNRLTSRAGADGICAAQLGAGWRMAEHHDGRYGSQLSSIGGWHFWAHGAISNATRFWAAVNDQNANPWS